MTALRLPVEAERFGAGWRVSDIGRQNTVFRADLLDAYEGLAEPQRRCYPATPRYPHWPARIAEEKARWSEDAALQRQFGDLMAAEESPNFVAPEAIAPRERGYVRESRTVKDSEQERYHDEFLREQTAANARPAPSEHRL